MKPDENDLHPSLLMLAACLGGILFAGGLITFLSWLRGYFPDAGWQWLGLGTLFAAGWACALAILFAVLIGAASRCKR